MMEGTMLDDSFQQRIAACAGFLCQFFSYLSIRSNASLSQLRMMQTGCHLLDPIFQIDGMMTYVRS